MHRSLLTVSALALIPTFACARSSATSGPRVISRASRGERKSRRSTARGIRDDDVAGGQGGHGRRQDDRSVLHWRHRAARTAERERRPHTDGGATVREIALRLGNAIAMPVLAYTPNSASATLPERSG